MLLFGINKFVSGFGKGFDLPVCWNTNLPAVVQIAYLLEEYVITDTEAVCGFIIV